MILIIAILVTKLFVLLRTWVKYKKKLTFKSNTALWPPPGIYIVSDCHSKEVQQHLLVPLDQLVTGLVRCSCLVTNVCSLPGSIVNHCLELHPLRSIQDKTTSSFTQTAMRLLVQPLKCKGVCPGALIIHISSSLHL